MFHCKTDVHSKSDAAQGPASMDGAYHQAGGTQHATPTAFWKAVFRQAKLGKPTKAIQGLPEGELEMVQHQTSPARISGTAPIQLSQLVRKSCDKEGRCQRLKLHQ